MWTYRSTMTKYSDMYGLKVTFRDGESAQTRTAELERYIGVFMEVMTFYQTSSACLNGLGKPLV